MNDIVQLRSGLARARLAPGAGGRVTALQLATPRGDLVEVLYPYPENFSDPVRWGKGGIYPLMPYSNRIASARVRVQGEDVLLQPHPDATPHSLHGNAHLLPWTVERHDASTAVLVLDAAPGPAWPWHYTGRLEIVLSPAALHMRIEIRNAGMRVMPAGIGLHPYFCHAPQAAVGYQALSVWPPTAEFLASTARAPGADEIYMPARVLPAGGLTHYVGGWGGRADIHLPQGAHLRIEAGPVFQHLVVHRPDNLAYLCLEPVSHVADGFNLAARGVPDTGTRWLAPGESLGGSMCFSLVDDQPC